MDWTGGTRRRYAGKGKGNAIVQKQKAHFAKARAANGYQVIPENFKQEPAVSRGIQPRANGFEPSPETFHNRSSHLDNHGQSTRREMDRKARKSMHLKHAERMYDKPNLSMTEEEAALIANRERLLARHDWLGLAPTRPVRIKFPSERERQRIGKRRKVDKPRARMVQPADSNAFAYPFEHRHLPFEPMMSGALGNDDIQIKVGTDAFLSQTHRSRLSHNSANTSIRPISTDFDPISEESMLMKADSDGFEAQEGGFSDRFEAVESAEPMLRDHFRQHLDVQTDDIASPNDRWPHRWDACAESSPVGEVEQFRYPHGPIESGTPLMQRDQYSHAIPDHTQEPSFMTAKERPGFGSLSEYDASANVGTHVLSSLRGQEEHSSNREKVLEPLAAEQSGTFPREAAQSARETLPYQEEASPPLASRYATLLQRTPLLHDSEVPASDSPDNEDDEQVWKRLMHVKQAVSSGLSMAALRSSSIHQTQSTTSAWPMATSAEIEADDEMLDVQEDLGDDYMQVEADNNQPVNYTQSNVVSTAISSPSPSHRQILQLVNQPPAVEIAQEDGQDELWRQYVIGSQNSQSQPSPGGDRRAWINRSEELLPARLSHEPEDEQFRSDRMTTGGSIHVVGSTDPEDEASSQNRTNTSRIGHATTINPERDDVEEPESSPRHRRKTTNIHANASAGTMPRRRYGTRMPTKYAPLPRVFPRVLTKGDTFANPRSIYDLSTSSR